MYLGILFATVNSGGKCESVGLAGSHKFSKATEKEQHFSKFLWVTPKTT